MTGLFSGMDLGEPEKASKPSVGGGNTFIAEYEGKYYLVPYEDNKDTAAEQFITGKLPPVGQAKSYEDIRRIQIERQKWGSMVQNPPVQSSKASPSGGMFSGYDLNTGQIGSIQEPS